MNKKILRLTLGLLVGLTCTVWSPARDEGVTASKKPTPKALQEAKAKAKAREKRLAVKAKAEAAARAKAVDLNRATVAELKKLPGITDAYATAIIANRPYKSKADLVTKNILPMGLYQTLHKQVAAK